MLPWWLTDWVERPRFSSPFPDRPLRPVTVLSLAQHCLGWEQALGAEDTALGREYSGAPPGRGERREEGLAPCDRLGAGESRSSGFFP